MFPHLPRPIIEHDLSITGSVEETCDRILSGALRNTTTTNQQTNAPINKTSNYLASTVDKEPPRVWNSSSQDRQLNLKQRKEFMVQQARK